MEYMHLVGAEQVERASSRMREAAEQFGSAVGGLRDVLETHQRFMDDWLIRFQEVIEKGLGPKP